MESNTKELEALSDARVASRRNEHDEAIEEACNH